MNEASKQTLDTVVKDYFQLSGLEFIEKYPIVQEEAYWNGEDGEGLIQALTATWEACEKATLTAVNEKIARMRLPENSSSGEYAQGALDTREAIKKALEE